MYTTSTLSSNRHVTLCDAPGFWLASLPLMIESAESNRLTLVKARSTWVITSKTSPTNPIEPLDQVNTPLWSTLGQRHGQTPLKTLTLVNVFRNFCRVLQNPPKHIKIYLYESCPACWGTQLSCGLAFQILSGKRWKTCSKVSTSCSWQLSGIQSWQALPAKSIEKNTI
jgi:hypothetical protein